MLGASLAVWQDLQPLLLFAASAAVWAAGASGAVSPAAGAGRSAPKTIPAVTSPAAMRVAVIISTSAPRATSGRRDARPETVAHSHRPRPTPRTRRPAPYPA